MNRAEILTYFHNNKILIQGLINKITRLQKRIETLENEKNNNNEENITENIISILASYDTKIELLEQKIQTLNNSNNSNTSIQDNLFFEKFD